MLRLSEAQIAALTDREEWAKPIAKSADLLRRLAAQAGLAAKVVDLKRLERRRALRAYNTLFLATGGWLGATYRIAGLEHLAEGVRPSKKTKVQIYRQMKRLEELEAKEVAKKSGEAAAVASSEPEAARAGAPEPVAERVSEAVPEAEAGGEGEDSAPFEPLRRALRLIKRAG